MICLLEDIPSSEPATQDEKGDWDIVGVSTERSNNQPPIVESIAPGEAQEQVAAMESNLQPSAEDQGPPSAAAVVVEQPEERGKEPPVEAVIAGEPDIVDIDSLLGALIIMVVRSML